MCLRQLIAMTLKLVALDLRPPLINQKSFIKCNHPNWLREWNCAANRRFASNSTSKGIVNGHGP